MDIEAAAKAAFDAFHVRFNRVRSWASHPDHDGVEPGRETFREMARAVDVIASAHPLDFFAVKTAEDRIAVCMAVFGHAPPDEWLSGGAPAPEPVAQPEVEHLV